jgi:hypothetical protein
VRRLILPLLRRTLETVTTETFKSLAMSSKVAVMEAKDSTGGRGRAGRERSGGAEKIIVNLQRISVNFRLDRQEENDKNSPTGAGAGIAASALV